MLVNDEILSLSLMYQKESIRETEKKEALFSFAGPFFIKTFQDLGFPYRIEDNMTAWKLFEDGGYFVLIGSVYKTKDSSFGFVWLMKSGIPQTGELMTEYLKIGNTVIQGDSYPAGVVPYTGWRRVLKYRTYIDEGRTQISVLLAVGLIASLIGLLSGFFRKRAAPK